MKRCEREGTWEFGNMNIENVTTAWFNNLSEEQKRAVLLEGLGDRLVHEGLSYLSFGRAA
jgi:hypothetical protein